MVHHYYWCVAVAVIVVVSGLVVPSATGDLLGKVCGAGSNDTGSYGANLDELSNRLPGVTAYSSSLFANVTVGNGSDTVYALALCRGDADAPACVECVTAALRDGRALCPGSRDTSVYHDVCLVCYSDSDFLAFKDNGNVVTGAGTPNFIEPTFPGWDPGNTRRVGAITSFVRVSLEDTARWAAYNTSARFATGRVDKTRGALRTLYSLAQCTPDMSAGDCWDCLKYRIDMTVNNFDGRQGGWSLGVRCGCRYETYLFYDGAAMMLNGSPERTVLNMPWERTALNGNAISADAPTPSDVLTPMALKPVANRGKLRIGTIIGIALPIIDASFAIAGFFFYMRRRRQARESSVPCSINQEDIQIMDSLILNLSTLQNATNNFDECNKLGEDGFGVVYKTFVKFFHTKFDI